MAPPGESLLAADPAIGVRAVDIGILNSSPSPYYVSASHLLPATLAAGRNRSDVSYLLYAIDAFDVSVILSGAACRWRSPRDAGQAQLHPGAALLRIVVVVPADAPARRRNCAGRVRPDHCCRLTSKTSPISRSPRSWDQACIRFQAGRCRSTGCHSATRSRSADDSSFGVELTLPVTFGFYDFELQDIEDGDIPTQVDSLSFVPGLTLVFDIRPEWTLEPYVEAGIARARDVNANANVYAVGVASEYEFGGQGFDWLLRNDLTFAGVDLRGTDGSHRFARLQTVLTARRPFSRESKVDYLVYALNEYYVEQPDGPIDSADRGGSSVQYEIGVTLGTTEPRRVWGMPVPRVGIGYRFGSHLDVFRIVIGTPFCCSSSSGGNALL